VDVLKNLPKFQNVSCDVYAVDLSSLSEEASRGETKKGQVSVVEKVPRPRSLRWPKQQDAELERRHFKRDDERFYIIQSNIQHMERSIGMLNQQI
jgi:hypothetical protein